MTKNENNLAKQLFCSLYSEQLILQRKTWQVQTDFTTLVIERQTVNGCVVGVCVQQILHSWGQLKPNKE